MSGSDHVLNGGCPDGEKEEGKPCFPSKGDFECRQRKKGGAMSTWQGRWSIYKMEERHIELDVYAGGWGFHTIVGRYTDGHYLCIPEWRVGCALSMSLCDTHWNYSSIAHCLKPFEAMSVTAALADFSSKTGWGNR